MVWAGILKLSRLESGHMRASCVLFHAGNGERQAVDIYSMGKETRRNLVEAALQCEDQDHEDFLRKVKKRLDAWVTLEGRQYGIFDDYKIFMDVKLLWDASWQKLKVAMTTQKICVSQYYMNLTNVKSQKKDAIFRDWYIYLPCQDTSNCWIFAFVSLTFTENSDCVLELRPLKCDLKFRPWD